MSAVEQEVRGREVGERLGDLVTRLEVAPADWAGVRHGVVRARRRRRAVLAAKVAGGTLAVVALLGTFQVGLVPYPSWAPAVPVSGLDGPSELAEGPTRGDLADDDVFLAGVRDQVVARVFEEGGGESWAVRSASDVDVVWADDIGAERWVLAEADYRFGVLQDRQQVWLVGPSGAPAEQLLVVDRRAVGDAAAHETGQWSGDARGVVVVTDAGRQVTVAGPPALTSDGAASRERTTAKAPDGVLVVALQDGGSYLVEVEGRVVLTTGPGQGVAAVRWSGRGIELGSRTVEKAAVDATSSMGLGPMDGTQVYSGGSGGPVLVALEAGSGARLLVMGHLTDGPPWRTTEVERFELVGFDVLQVRPAGTDDLAAWQLGRTTWTEDPTDPPRTRHTLSDSDESWTGVDDASPSVAVVGPVGATEAELVDADGLVLERFPLADGAGGKDTGSAEEAVAARFLGTSGEVLGTTPVVKWAPAGGAPQLSP